MSKKSAKSSSNGNPTGMNTAAGDAFLPPICVNKVDSGDNASEEDEADDGVNMTAPSEVPLPRKSRRTKHKHHHNRHVVNKSSMSDSFVLPMIGGSPPGSGAGVKRDGWILGETRAATHPERKNERRYGGMPISKSCPILGRHRYDNSNYDKDQFESDDEDSDAETDFKSMSFNVGATTKYIRNKGLDKNCNVCEHPDDMTSGVLCKLAKLESPRKIEADHTTHSSSSSARTKLPNIFPTKYTDNGGKEVQHMAKKSLLAKYENANKQLAIDPRTKPAKRLPESPDSRTLEPCRPSPNSCKSKILIHSPRLLKTQDGDLIDGFPSETSPLRTSKTRRKNKKRHEKSEDKNSTKHVKEVGDFETPDNEIAEDKCRQWLDETQQKTKPQNTLKETEVVK